MEQQINKRKKVFLMAYARRNLGDDIFIKMLLEKYDNVDFTIRIRKYEFIEWLDKYENLNVIIGDDFVEELYKLDEETFDGYVFIGGSIFLEGGRLYNISDELYDFVKRCKAKNIPFCYISSNYGPYKTQEYFDMSKKIFRECTDICFRDLYSYNLFKELDSVRYVPDFVFSYLTQKEEKIPNSVGISVIDLDIKIKGKELGQGYLNFLEKSIKEYLKCGKTVYLYSFCEYEGDSRIVDLLVEKFKDVSTNVFGIKYEGNIDEFLKMYSKMEYMICGRFHAMILSSIYRQKMYVMSYSKKMDNVNNDLKLELPLIHFEEIEDNTILKIDEFKKVQEDKILDIIERAKKQDAAFQLHMEK